MVGGVKISLCPNAPPRAETRLVMALECGADVIGHTRGVSHPAGQIVVVCLLEQLENTTPLSDFTYVMSTNSLMCMCGWPFPVMPARMVNCWLY